MTDMDHWYGVTCLVSDDSLVVLWGFCFCFLFLFLFFKCLTRFALWQKPLQVCVETWPIDDFPCSSQTSLQSRVALVESLHNTLSCLSYRRNDCSFFSFFLFFFFLFLQISPFSIDNSSLNGKYSCRFAGTFFLSSGQSDWMIFISKHTDIWILPGCWL